MATRKPSFSRMCLETIRGAKIEDVARDAVRLARENKCVVVFHYNGCDLIVEKMDTIKKVMEVYYEYRRKGLEGY